MFLSVDGAVVNLVCTPPRQPVERPMRPLTPPERDALLVMGHLLPNMSQPRPQQGTVATSTPPLIKSEPGIPQQQPQPPPMMTPPTPQSSTPSPTFPPPRPRHQLAFPRQPDPVKNLMPSDVVLKQTVPMKDNKQWRTLPNSRIRVMITGPVEPLVQKDIDRCLRACLKLNTLALADKGIQHREVLQL